jgi:hypothetical protein
MLPEPLAPRRIDSIFWLELRGTYPHDAPWCKCCEVKVEERLPGGGWSDGWAQRHFYGPRHQENYELARLAGEVG